MNPHRLLLREKLAYGCGDFASCLFWAAFSYFLPIFYTDVFGISAAAVGTLLLVSRVWDGIDDPLIGMLADRTNTRWGKFRPFLLWIAVPYAVVGTLLFTTPDLGATGKLVWAYVTYNLMMILYTAVNIPYTALLGVITSDSIERTRVASMKFIFANAAYIVLPAILLVMVRNLGGGNEQRGWQLSFAAIGLVAVLFFLLTFLGTRERVVPSPHQKTSAARDLKDLLGNGPWFFLVGITVMFVLFLATHSTVSAHYIKYFVGAQTFQMPWDAAPREYDHELIMGVFLPAGSIGAILGIFLAGPIVARIGKKTAYIGSFAVAIICSIAFFWLQPHQLFTMVVLQFIRSLAGGPLAVILWAMYADAADYSEWKNSRRATGLVFSASTMTQKFCWGIAGVIVGRMLHATGFEPNVVQSEKVLDGLVLLMGVVPSAFGVLSIAIMLFYPLNEMRVAAMQEELRRRRSTLSQTEPVTT
jgi:glycoside/pentoside/hexuronide:cation symporter, GPH family